MVVTGVGMVGVDPVDDADVVGIVVKIHPYLEVFSTPNRAVLMLSQAFREQCKIGNANGHSGLLQSLKDVDLSVTYPYPGILKTKE